MNDIIKVGDTINAKESMTSLEIAEVQVNGKAILLITY